MSTETVGDRSQAANFIERQSPLWEPVSVRRDLGCVSSSGATERVYRRAGGCSNVVSTMLSAGAAAGGRSGRESRSALVGLPAAGGSHDDRHLRREPRLMIVDDCTLYREYLAAVFAADGAPAPAVAWDLESLLAALTDERPSLVLVNLDTRDSAMLLRATFEICPHSKVIVLGMAEDDETGIVACAEAGVAGYHLRTDSLSDLRGLIQRVADGETSCSPRVSAILMRRLSALATQRQPAAKDLVLTVREAQILRMLEKGLSNRDIADELCIAIHTVKNHVHNLLHKLGVSTRAEAAARFRTVVFTESDLED
ncbi:DNA-binding response regulator [Mycobacterium sp. CBMA 234]|uniref:LuxR C-terminal-related transcriptional regulator n=1 Tax=Mycolicibacterium sp. CBMA 234 TaxID=1918495 RepID=UPI0012DC5551|nr:response regulator transcription factor [Mycolicibacterium sp. CBMA 234]MUL64648.1 DNA-binding response regulator [Mycolicibacterium sp. CBMA 234]